MRTVKLTQIRLPDKYADLQPIFSDIFTKILAQFDLRSEDTEFASGIKYDGTDVVLGNDAVPVGRTGGIPSIVQRLTDGGRATDQRLLPMVNFGNISSVQSADPISATAGAMSSDLTIAAHTLHTDFGNIAYNSGSILGLALNTRFYVYVDDPDNLGGAVTYVASSSKPTVPANTGRYLVGSIVTPVSASTSNISAATSANPIHFTTTAAHGWSTANIIDFASLPGDFAALNTGTYPIIVIDSDEFTVAVDGSTFAAYTAGGTATRVVPDEFPDYGGGGGGSLP